ncbi:uncharacterized protein LOC115552038 [Gadus morhua]|uniref:uncharacterized protein LOC115552038 n=1 Tax=Gadus morhua TaxID=8049 RepID=UPI0011B4479B|nr:uncharacterized protein LOC115552038 [Gadus morhua]
MMPCRRRSTAQRAGSKLISSNVTLFLSIPVLKVLICKSCYKFYRSDDISKDSDGMDEQCRARRRGTARPHPTLTMALVSPQVASSSAEVKNASTQQLSSQRDVREADGDQAAPAAASYNTFTAGKRPAAPKNPAVVLALDRVNADGTGYSMGQGPSVLNGGRKRCNPMRLLPLEGFWGLPRLGHCSTGPPSLEVWAPSLTLGRDGPGIILKEGKAPVLRKGLEASQISDLNSNRPETACMQSAASAHSVPPVNVFPFASLFPTRHRVSTTYLAQEDSELSLLQGERVLVHRPRPDGRLLVTQESTGHTGLFHSSILPTLERLS